MPNTRERQILLAIVLATLAGTAAFFAQGVTALVASWLLPLDPAVAAPAPTGAIPGARRASAVQPPKDPRPLLVRNVFDHQLGDLTRPPPVEGPAGEDEEIEITDPDAIPYCDGSMRLAGTLVHPRRPDLSIATITDASGKAMLYRTASGENVVDGRTVVTILPFSVHLRPETGQVCRLAMFDTEAPRTATVRRRKPEETPSRLRSDEREEDDEYAEGISQTGQNQYTVDRGLVDRLLTNQAELMRSARIIPHSEDGRVVGVKLYGIRRSSLLSRLGLQNGDMLRTINGFDMTSPDKALEAYARLRSADSLSVNVVRRGEATTLDYTIQ